MFRNNRPIMYNHPGAIYILNR